jgi:hypothetical protein
MLPKSPKSALLSHYTTITGFRQRRLNKRSGCDSTRAAILTNLLLEEGTSCRCGAGYPKAREDIIWVLDKADNVLSAKRNDALHTPFSMVIDGFRARLASDWMSGAPRARRLRDKDLLEEFEWNGAYADALSVFCDRIMPALASPKGSMAR